MAEQSYWTKLAEENVLGVANENKQKTEPKGELIYWYVQQINQQDREMFPDEQFLNEKDFYVEIFIYMQSFYIHCSSQKQPPEVFYKKRVLRNFTKLTGKHLCQAWGLQLY